MLYHAPLDFSEDARGAATAAATGAPGDGVVTRSATVRAGTRRFLLSVLLAGTSGLSACALDPATQLAGVAALAGTCGFVTACGGRSRPAAAPETAAAAATSDAPANMMVAQADTDLLGEEPDEVEESEAESPAQAAEAAPAAAGDIEAEAAEGVEAPPGEPETAVPLPEAAEAPPPERLTLAQVLSKVWREHPSVRQAEQGLQAAGYEVSGARAGYYPYAQVSSAFAEQREENQSTLVLVQPLWSGGLTMAQVSAAKARERGAMAEVARTRLELGLRVAEVYVNIVQAQEQARQWSRYVGSLKKLLASIERRAREGVAPEADVQTALTRLRQAEAGAEANKAVLLANRAELVSLIGAQPGAVEWPDESSLLTDEDLADVRARRDLHPDRLSAESEIEAQEAEAREARAALWPELSLQHRQQIEGTEFDPSNDATVLALTYQTLNGLRGFRGYQAEKRRAEAARARLEAVKRDIDTTLDVDRAQLAALTSQLVVQGEAAKAASALVDSFARQYEVGRKTWLEVLNAQREANETLIQSISIKRNYWYVSTKLALDSMRWERLSADPIAQPPATPVAAKE